MVLFDIALIGLLARVPSTGQQLMASLMLMMVIVTRKLVVGRTSGRGSRRLFMLFFQAFFNVFGDALTCDALTPFAEVRPQRTFLLILAEGTRVFGRFGLWFALGHIVAVSLLLLFLHLLSAAFGGTVQRVLKCSIGELFVVPVERVPKGPILDTIAHVVDIHFEGKRLEAVSATERKPE